MRTVDKRYIKSHGLVKGFFPMNTISDGPRIFVVIPAYQASTTLREVFSRIPPEISRKNVTYLIVNDGSTDGTESIAGQIMSQNKAVRVINHEKNRGYAQAQKTGFRIALDEGADIVALLHADAQYAPELLPRLLEPLEKGQADVVQGSRMLNARDAIKGRMPAYKWIANKILTAIENATYGMKLAEYHSGYMLYTERTLRTIPFEKLSDTFHFDGEMLMMAGKKRLRIREIPIPTHYGDEKSHLKPISYGFSVFKIVLKFLLGRYDF